jgi:molybdate transport system substrate-binding protein
MRLRNAAYVLLAIAFETSCESHRPADQPKLTVAAAANLTDVFREAGQAYSAETGVKVVFSYGSTAPLAQQIENGAPFDLFAAADTEHVDELVSSGNLTADSRAVYASGQLALWSPTVAVHDLKDLERPEIRFIAVAQPELAPYGRASVEALKRSGLWDKVESKIVYAASISQARQLADSGNADVTFTAYSLVLHDRGTVLKVERELYRPIDQALGIVTSSRQIEQAKQFRTFLLGPEGRTILARNGYLLPNR